MRLSVVLSQAAQAARANLIPGLCIQFAMIGVVAAYYTFPAVAAALHDVAELKARGGYLFSMASAVLGGAIVPEMLKISLLQHGRIHYGNLADMRFNAAFWALQGLCVDWFYRSQATWFGTAATLSVLTHKVLVDQLLYTPLYAVPFAVICFEWRNLGYKAPLRSFFTREFYGTRVLPTLVANWAVWIPVVCAIYALPSLLQVPLFALALSFWSLMLTWLNQPAAAPPCREAA